MRIAVAAALAVVVAAGSAFGQGDRVHLLSRVNSYDGMGSGGFDYNDVLGYVASDGTEVCLLGTWNGTSFIDTTNPTAPVELKFINHSASLWSDMAVWQDYVYVVTDQSAGGGLQIIDVSDLTNINVAGSWTGFNTAHSLFIDQTAGMIYCCGTDIGLVILDLANPTSPQHVVTYTNNYVHEATAQNGIAHFSEIYAGNYRVVDVSALPTLTTLDVLSTPAHFTHSSTVDETDSIVGMTDEVKGAKLVIYNVSDPTNVQQLSTFVENPAGILHNVFVSNGVAQLSAYAEGYVALDVSDPAHPIRLGSYDTWAGKSGNFNGAWGVWQQPSGTIYISNIEDGLFVLSRATLIRHDGLPDTTDVVGPYVVTAKITPSSAGGGVTYAKVEYTTDGVNSIVVAMAPTGNPDEWSAAIPGQPLGTTVEYWLRASDSLGTSCAPANKDGHFVFGVGERRSFYAENFDGATDGGWTHGAVSGTDDWQRGTPGRQRLDPYRTTSDFACFGNDLGISGGDGLYANGSDNWLESPAVDLTNLHGVRLRFERWLRVEDAAMDVARVLVNGVEVWRNPTNGGSLPVLDHEWATIDLDVSAVADDTPATKVRFELKTDAANAFGGWNVDDVELYAISTRRDSESYGNGAAGSGGFVPKLDTVGDAFIGGAPFGLDGSDLLGGANGLVLVGFARVQVPFKGLDLLVDLAPPAFLVPVLATGPAGSPGVGTFSLSSSIPDDPSMVGVEVDTQVLTFDPGAPKGLASSAGRAFWICQ